MAKPNNPNVRIDPKLAEELRKIQEQMKKDLGVKITTAQASKIFLQERILGKGGKLKF